MQHLIVMVARELECALDVCPPGVQQLKSFTGRGAMLVGIHYHMIGTPVSAAVRLQLRFMGLAFGGKELVIEEDPNLNLRKIHYHLIRDKGLSLVSFSEKPKTL